MEDDEAELTLNKVEEEMMVRLVLTAQIPFCCFLPPGNLPLHLDNKDIFKNTAAVLPWIAFIKTFCAPYHTVFSSVY